MIMNDLTGIPSSGILSAPSLWHSSQFKYIEETILKQLEIVQKVLSCKNSLPLEPEDHANFAIGVTTLFENIAKLTKFSSEECKNEL